MSRKKTDEMSHRPPVGLHVLGQVLASVFQLIFIEQQVDTFLQAQGLQAC
jgi:hypothetical protein